MATVTAKRLTETTFLTLSAAVMVANPASKRTFVQLITLHNTHTSTVSVEIWNVPDASGAVGTPALVNRKYKISINPDDTILVDLGKPGLILEDENDTIQASADVTSVVNIEIVGFEE